MDKQTLSNYGWIVICCLVLVVMIALATPFGKFIGEGFKSSYEGFSSVSDKALGVVGISTGNGSGVGSETGTGNPTTPEPPASGYIIPEGGVVELNGITYNAGEEFPANETGMIFRYGDYEYMYNGSYFVNRWIIDEDQNGWGVGVQDTSKTTYGEILGSINNAPIVSMYYTFSACTNLTTAPAIPSSVTNMRWTFYGCTSLTTAPAIPNSVTDMEATFYGCTSLTTAPTIPSSVTDMHYAFQNCTSLITAPDMSNANGVKYMTGTFDGCTSLTTAPTIPSSVTDMYGTFINCTALTGEVEINASNLDDYDYCFYGTIEPITLTGTCPQLSDLASTGNNGNVSVQ